MIFFREDNIARQQHFILGDIVSIINKFSEVLSYAQTEYLNKNYSPFSTVDGACNDGNFFAFGDNIDLMKYLLSEKDMFGKIQQIYIDPPFYSKANYDAWVRNPLDSEKKIKKRAYEDIWKEGMEEYLKMLALRFMFMKDLLSDEGTIWVHLDWHGAHYVKVLMDEIFGEKNFVNEIIWTYKSGGSSKKHFARKHDTILVYSKTPKYYLNVPKEKSYNRGFKPYRFKGVEEFEDEKGWYTLVNMKDVWNIDMVGRTSKERTGYATQKPEALLERIILAGSREGDYVADFFAGSGTLGAVCKKTNRHYIMSDNSQVAVDNAAERLGFVF